MSGIDIKRLRAGDDLAEATQLLQRFFAEEGFTTPAVTIAANARRMTGIDSCGLFVALDGEETIGVATVSLEFGIEFGWSAEMGDLYVLPEWRGRGVSRALVSAIEEFLISLDANGYQVTVTPFAEEHHGLKRFYTAMGFESEGRLILYKTLKRPTS